MPLADLQVLLIGNWLSSSFAVRFAVRTVVPTIGRPQRLEWLDDLTAVTRAKEFPYYRVDSVALDHARCRLDHSCASLLVGLVSPRAPSLHLGPPEPTLAASCASLVDIFQGQPWWRPQRCYGREHL
jgi:hypothetical protein